MWLAWVIWTVWPKDCRMLHLCWDVLAGFMLFQCLVHSWTFTEASVVTALWKKTLWLRATTKMHAWGMGVSVFILSTVCLFSFYLLPHLSWVSGFNCLDVLWRADTVALPWHKDRYCTTVCHSPCVIWSEAGSFFMFTGYTENPLKCNYNGTAFRGSLTHDPQSCCFSSPSLWLSWSMYLIFLTWWGKEKTAWRYYFYRFSSENSKSLLNIRPFKKNLLSQDKFITSQKWQVWE